MKRIIFLIAISITATALCQDRRLTFTSVTDAKFFVFLNGVLQNQRPSGMVTLQGLEDKEYHVRIVIDDPYEVSVTRSIRPDPKHSEYNVQFNAVKERVYLKAAKTQHDETQWAAAEEPDEGKTQEAETPKAKPRPVIKRHATDDTETQRIVKKIKESTLE